MADTNRIVPQIVVFRGFGSQLPIDAPRGAPPSPRLPSSYELLNAFFRGTMKIFALPGKPPPTEFMSSISVSNGG